MSALWVLEILTVFPDAALEAVKAEVWEEGARRALLSEGYSVVDHAAVLTQNPYHTTETKEAH